MSKLKTLSVFVGCAMLAIACLAGCSPSMEDSPFTGYWELTGMEENGVPTSQDDIELIRQFGVETTLEMSGDGNVHANFLGTKMDGTWKAFSATEAEAELDKQTVNMTLNGDELVLAQDNTNMTLIFKKSEQSASQEGDGSGDVSPEEEEVAIPQSDTPEPTVIDGVEGVDGTENDNDEVLIAEAEEEDSETE